EGSALGSRPGGDQRLAHGLEQGRHRLVQRPGDRAARGVLVTAAAEAVSDSVDRHVALAAQTRLHRARPLLVEQHRDLDSPYRARVADQILGIEKIARDETARHAEPGDLTIGADLNPPQHLAELDQRIARALLVETVRD